jgi:hypothetical protein
MHGSKSKISSQNPDRKCFAEGFDSGVEGLKVIEYRIEEHIY